MSPSRRATPNPGGVTNIAAIGLIRIQLAKEAEKAKLLSESEKTAYSFIELRFP